jgi:hypothetical protein
MILSTPVLHDVHLEVIIAVGIVQAIVLLNLALIIVIVGIGSIRPIFLLFTAVLLYFLTEEVVVLLALWLLKLRLFSWLSWLQLSDLILLDVDLQILKGGLIEVDFQLEHAFLEATDVLSYLYVAIVCRKLADDCPQGLKLLQQIGSGVLLTLIIESFEPMREVLIQPG